ncbi:hypothetical protein IAT38_002239 [Cryptococcus sp. DSM 104549]
MNKTLLSKIEPPHVYPHAWREIVNGTIEENFAPIALSTLNNLIREENIPPAEHIQLIMYLGVNPIPHGVDPALPFALLDRLLDLHSPVYFAGSIPAHPSSTSNNKSPSGYPPWMSCWEGDRARSDLHKTLWRAMRRCLDEGVWALIWEGAEDLGKKPSKVKKEVVDDDDDDEESKEVVVGETGWRMLEWLVDVWEKDLRERKAAEEPKEYSPLLLRQLAKPYDKTGTMQRNDASVPLDIVGCAFLAPPQADNALHRRTASRLFRLAMQAATCPSPPFSPSALASSTVYALRDYPTAALQLFSEEMAIALPAQPLAHIYSLLLEDLGGLRQAKTAERREAKRRRIGSGEFEEGWNGLGLPKLDYLMRVLLSLGPSKGGDEAVRRANMLHTKLALVTLLHANKAYSGEEHEGTRAELRGDAGVVRKIEESFVVPRQPRGTKAEPEGPSATSNVLLMIVNKILSGP